MRFPYVAASNRQGDTSLIPMLPIELRSKEGKAIRTHGLVDSGASVNVLPYSVGIQLGAVWDNQTVPVRLGGTIARQEARALLLDVKIPEFDSVPLVFAWSRADEVRLILGQTNFFDTFDVLFSRSRRFFEIHLVKGS